MKCLSALLIILSTFFSSGICANFLKSLSQSPSLKPLKRQYDYRKNSPRMLDKGIDTLNKKRSPIDVSGEHSFIPPDFENGAQRGPCPGLNALANHGYIPRDGIVGMLEVAEAINEVYGMGMELATILGVMGTVDVGNPISLDPGFSIGGKSDEVSNLLDNLSGPLGTPRGLYGSHNFIETDSSNTRDDLYQTGDAWTMNMTLFMQAFESTDTDFLSMEDIGNRAAARFADSIATNPFFYYGPYTGLVARNAGYCFAGRLLGNHTDEHPEGLLTKDVFKSFFAVYGEPGNFEYKFGWEQIPENWFRTPSTYGLVDLNLDIVNWVLQHPELASIGGNTGEVNSFVGLDLSNITSGILNVKNLLEGNNLMCLALEVVKTFAPNSLSPLFATLSVPLGLLTDVISAPILSLACPEFTDLAMNGKPLWETLLGQFPGAARSASAM